MTGADWTRTGITLLAAGIGAGLAIALFGDGKGRECETGTPSPEELNIDFEDPVNDVNGFLRYAQHKAIRFHPSAGEHTLSSAPYSDTGPTRPATPGALGQIRAEQCSYKNEPQALERGRVVAMVHMRRAGNSPWPVPDRPGYRKLHIHGDGTEHVHPYFPSGWSYVWIDAFEEAADGTVRARAVIVSRDGQEINQTQVEYESHTYAHQSAYGDFRWNPNDDHAWETCTTHGCCHIKDALW